MDSCRGVPLHAPPGVAMLDPNISTISWSRRQLCQLHQSARRDPYTRLGPVNQVDCRRYGPSEAVLADSVQSPASEREEEATGQAPSGCAPLCCSWSYGIEWSVCPWDREVWGGGRRWRPESQRGVCDTK